MPAITPFLWFDDTAEEAGVLARQPLWRPRTQRVMKAMLHMVKLDVTRLQEAANES